MATTNPRRALLDTVAFVWAASAPERLSMKARAVIEDGEVIRELSALSISEIALKHATGKLPFDAQAVGDAIKDLRLRILAFTEADAMRLFDLPLHHRDPFDRQIIAQSLANDIPVISCDEHFKSYRQLRVIW
jgi:PIN domain nuclease of toxin-antitoxin system